jgi:L-asparaginase II
LPVVLGGGIERFQLEDADLALICASHGGTPAHTERAASLLRRGGFTVGDLLCGAHPPLDRESARALRERGETPTALHNNCSGKHSGMLLGCRLSDWSAADYIALGHPLQQRILEQLAVLAEVPMERIGVGIDGCSAPAFQLPLNRLAVLYAILADPRLAGVAEPVASALETLVRAMSAAPDMVAGPGRFTTELARATGGRVLGKEGAEGVYAVAVRGPVALGLAVKIADGGERCRDGVVLQALRQIGALSGEELRELERFAATPLVNWGGTLVGEIVPELELEVASDGGF